MSKIATRVECTDGAFYAPPMTVQQAKERLSWGAIGVAALRKLADRVSNEVPYGDAWPEVEAAYTWEITGPAR